jgi:hypothetical protein
MATETLSRTEYLALADDERPHLYPDREPSNATYTGTRNQPGCRCTRCRAQHAAAVKKNRQVIQLVPESVTDEPVPAGVPESSAVPAAEALSGAPEASASPQVVQPVYSDPGALTADEVAARILKIAVDCVAPSGALPPWMITAPEIASRFGVSLAVAAQATRINARHIQISPLLNGGKGAVALVKRPIGIR